MQHRSEAGESLIEVVMAILVLGGAIAALLAAVTTAVNSSVTHRELVESDTVMRNYAEATKQAVRDDCAGGVSGGNYSVSYSSPGFTFSTAPSGQACPDAGDATPLTLTVTGPTGAKTMDIMVRRP